MKLIIAGSRTITCKPYEIYYLLKHFNLSPTEIVSGTARGVDQSGEAFANDVKLPIKKFPADWDQYGKSAGHKRNHQMAEYGDHLLLIWDGQSKGSAGMKAIMQRLGKPITEVLVKS